MKFQISNSPPSPLPCFGLTGSVACGKSTVASRFLALGAKVIDADQIGHELLLRPSTTYAEILRQFGGKILNPDGEINRKLLGAIVFAHPEKRRKLNSILHPQIIERQEDLVRQYNRENPKAIILVDAALIYEAGVESHFRKILVAWCTPEQQIERLMAKTGLTRNEASARVAAQMPAEDKRRRADFVIDCSGSHEHTLTQVDALYPQLKRLMEENPP